MQIYRERHLSHRVVPQRRPAVSGLLHAHQLRGDANATQVDQAALRGLSLPTRSKQANSLFIHWREQKTNGHHLTTTDHQSHFGADHDRRATRAVTAKRFPS